MTATPYKIYMVFENEAVEGKYIPLLYTASDVVNENAVLRLTLPPIRFRQEVVLVKKKYICLEMS